MEEHLTSLRLIARKVGASMKTAKVILVVGVLLFAAADLVASGPVGIYAIIEKVIFEPSEQAPERIQIWGAFAVVEGGLARPGATSKPRLSLLQAAGRECACRRKNGMDGSQDSRRHRAGHWFWKLGFRGQSSRLWLATQQQFGYPLFFGELAADGRA